MLDRGARSAASQSGCIHSRPTQSNHESPCSSVSSSKDGGKNAEKVTARVFPHVPNSKNQCFDLVVPVQFRPHFDWKPFANCSLNPAWAPLRSAPPRRDSARPAPKTMLNLQQTLKSPRDGTR